ncbi:MAG: acyl-CoA dehydratase activase, partial [Prevotellaceae bacterium]|nr:acyl-CoA dehydratase activase [Prevotellaceae bacterium]
MIRIGIDVGSTTAKMVALNDKDELLFTRYERHNARTKELIVKLLQELQATVGDEVASLDITGSVGMGVAEKCALPFIQEVVAATYAIRRYYPATRSMIDIGGEDAKVVFFHNGQASDLRMNGNCAGGTGAFIDQMAVILGVDVDALGELALRADRVYPIASRCGVFCKTDIQNLIAKNVSRENIAASIFHAVTVQTVVTLAHGCDIEVPVLFCGGPLTFIPALRKAFVEYLGLREADVILPRKGTLLPALGAALAPVKADAARPLSQFTALVENGLKQTAVAHTHLAPIFKNKEDYRAWQARMSRCHVETAPLGKGRQEMLLGIDSGSTTTKIVATDLQGRLLYSFYRANGGNPVEAVEEGLNGLRAKCLETDTEPIVTGSCSTGYGEDLVKAAFQLDGGIVETIAHHIGARHFNPEVSFILDIGGQDMKAIFVTGGVIDRIEINEACSSGCGSFIETFAKTLGYTAGDFATAACRSAAPCDLGTRCTVFMNSKVKQVLREGATLDDIAAGLAYSVVKNCLYKVLKLKDTSVLGKHIVVQGGTMRNDAIVRALEELTGAEVTRSDIPELMGAYGCARYAESHRGRAVALDQMIGKARYSTRFLHCKGCDNRCLVVRYLFQNGKAYFSGNRCEKVFTNGEASAVKGVNVYTRKNELLFNRNSDIERPLLTVGIPRCLNMYEEYPFWHTLLTACGIRVVLSDLSNFAQYEQCARMVMSDNICFPAKLVHSHIQDLLTKKVDRIFMPFVIFEKGSKEQNSYNCPIVTGYAEVVKGVQADGVPVDAPAITFKDRGLLLKQCRAYLKGLGVADAVITKAFGQAEAAMESYARDLSAYNEQLLQEARGKGMLTVLLAGRPYHADMLIQHKVSDLLAGMGIQVVSDDIVRGKDITVEQEVHFLAQWAYPNRILKAAQWCAAQGSDVQFVEMTSFGCGPDAFLTDGVRDLLLRHGKALTLLKMDDINNIG